jgi:hypothetical protein
VPGIKNVRFEFHLLSVSFNDRVIKSGEAICTRSMYNEINTHCDCNISMKDLGEQSVEDKTKMDHNEGFYKDMNWIHLVQNGAWWWTLVNMLKNLQVP